VQFGQNVHASSEPAYDPHSGSQRTTGMEQRTPMQGDYAWSSDSASNKQYEPLAKEGALLRQVQVVRNVIRLSPGSVRKSAQQRSLTLQERHTVRLVCRH
jgi:hypothetical protein